MIFKEQKKKLQNSTLKFQTPSLMNKRNLKEVFMSDFN